MRPDDVIECSAFGHTPKQALRLALQTSSICLTAFVDDRPEAMMGLVVNNALCGEGAPWMLGTEAIYDHPREMIRMGPRILKLFSDSTPAMTGLVGSGNVRAIRLLRRWGFTIGLGVIVFAGVELIPFEYDGRCRCVI
jgi:hypothetical protein